MWQSPPTKDQMICLSLLVYSIYELKVLMSWNGATAIVAASADSPLHRHATLQIHHPLDSTAFPSSQPNAHIPTPSFHHSAHQPTPSLQSPFHPLTLMYFVPMPMHTPMTTFFHTIMAQPCPHTKCS